MVKSEKEAARNKKKGIGNLEDLFVTRATKTPSLFLSPLHVTMSWKQSLSRHLTVLRFFGCPESASSRGVM
jgi:hypothetical protein